MIFLRVIFPLLMSGCLEGTLPSTVDVDMDEPDVPVIPVIDMAPDVPQPVYGGPCDPFLQDCEAGKCVPNPSTGESLCLAELTNLGAGDPCDSITQCMRGTYCATLGGGTPLCWPMCDIVAIADGATDTCTPGTACVARITSIPSVGLCSGDPSPCDILAQTCATGDCVVMRNPVTSEVGTFCGRGGNLTTGESCANSPGGCSRWHVCVLASGNEEPTCQRVCSTSGPFCTGSSCTGVAPESGVGFCE